MNVYFLHKVHGFHCWSLVHLLHVTIHANKERMNFKADSLINVASGVFRGGGNGVAPLPLRLSRWL